jgi:hypothetical protein
MLNLDKEAIKNNPTLSKKQVMVKSDLLDALNKEKYFPVSGITTGGKQKIGNN